jgi:hypothetical protein
MRSSEQIAVGALAIKEVIRIKRMAFLIRVFAQIFSLSHIIIKHIGILGFKDTVRGF